MLIKLEIHPHICTVTAPYFNVSITSHAAKRLDTDIKKTIYMLRLLVQVMEKHESF